MTYANYQREKLPDFVRYIDDLMRYRHLCWNLVESDLRTRFRRSYFGILWAVLQPLGYSLIIAWAWHTLFGRQHDYWEFAVYVFNGMLVWEYFNNTIMTSLDGLTNATGYLRQSRIPFFVFQIRVPLTGAVIFVFGLAGLGVLMSVLGFTGAYKPAMPGLHLILLPLFMLLLVSFMTPIAISASVLGAQLRDLKHVTQLALQALFFLSPVMMPRENMLDGQRLAILQYANPIVPLLDMIRDPILFGKWWELRDLLVVSVWIAGLWLLAVTVSSAAGRRIVFSL